LEYATKREDENKNNRKSDSVFQNATFYMKRGAKELEKNDLDRGDCKNTAKHMSALRRTGDFDCAGRNPEPDAAF
jgi:hypothetical protein